MNFVIYNYYFDAEQAIDSKNGGTFINRNTIRNYSVIERKQNEPNFKLIDHLRCVNLPWNMARKKYWIAGLVVAFLLLVTATVVPISIYALNDTKSLESTTIPSTETTALVPKKRGRPTHTKKQLFG